ncbi:MAG TPA: hypothetical protein PKZ65_11515, partial [Methanoregulaceae archaeon]|nr:hypothetical protein [Methanoregulaceae archaeon]
SGDPRIVPCEIERIHVAHHRFGTLPECLELSQGTLPVCPVRAMMRGERKPNVARGTGGAGP